MISCYSLKHEWFQQSGERKETVLAKQKNKYKYWQREKASGYSQRIRKRSYISVHELKDREKIIKFYVRSALCPGRSALRGPSGSTEGRKQVIKNARATELRAPSWGEKVREFSGQMGVQDLETSSDRLFRFRERQGISCEVV
jgi:hypothetical protein